MERRGNRAPGRARVWFALAAACLACSACVGFAEGAAVPDCDGIGRPPRRVGTGKLDAEEVITIFAFVVSIALMLFGPAHAFRGLWMRFFRSDPPWFLASTVYAPFGGILFLIFVQGVADVRQLIDGDLVWGVIKDKFDIVLLIQSYAYLSISLDISNFFKLCAYTIVKRANGNGKKLFIGMYFLISALAFFTSNDIVIISMTPIIIYVGIFSGIKNLIPLLLMQVIAANTTAMGTYIGSPTNIVIGDSVNITFIEYTLWMFFPTVVSIGITLAMLMAVFFWHPFNGVTMQETFKPLDVDIEVLLLQKLPTADELAAAEEAETEMAAAAAAGDAKQDDAQALPLVPPPSAGPEPPAPPPPVPAAGGPKDKDEGRAAAASSSDGGLHLSPGARSDDEAEAGQPAAPGVSRQATMVAGSHMTNRRTMWIKVVVFVVCLLFLLASNVLRLELWQICVVAAGLMVMYDSYLTHLDGSSAWEMVQAVAHRMPWGIAPFVFAMFTLVEVVTRQGLTARFANWMLEAAGGKPADWLACLEEPRPDFCAGLAIPPHDSGADPFAISMVFGYVSALLVNVLNDIPSTVFWSNMMPVFCGSLNQQQYRTLVFALLVGVNPGCYLTLIGALAGIMWSTIIKRTPGAQNLIVPTGRTLTYYSSMVISPVIFICCLMVYIEVLIIDG